MSSTGEPSYPWPSTFFILDQSTGETRNVTAPEFESWMVENGGWKGPHRQIALTEVGDRWASTIFLGIDHSFGYGPPLLFETVVFKGKMDDTSNAESELFKRYATIDEAKAGHQAIVDELRRRQEFVDELRRRQR